AHLDGLDVSWNRTPYVALSLWRGPSSRGAGGVAGVATPAQSGATAPAGWMTPLSASTLAAWFSVEKPSKSAKASPDDVDALVCRASGIYRRICHAATVANS